jgi:hypothetical protein
MSCNSETPRGVGHHPLLRQTGGAPGTRPIYLITCDEGTEVAVTAGEEGVVAIIAGQPFFIFRTASRRPVPWQSVTERVFFDEE